MVIRYGLIGKAIHNQKLKYKYQAGERREAISVPRNTLRRGIHEVLALVIVIVASHYSNANGSKLMRRR